MVNLGLVFAGPELFWVTKRQFVVGPEIFVVRPKSIMVRPWLVVNKWVSLIAFSRTRNYMSKYRDEN